MAADEALQAGILEQTQELLSRVDRAFDLGIASITVQAGHLAMDGAAASPELADGIGDIHAQLVNILGKGVEALQRIHELAPGHTPTVELTVGRAATGMLELGPGDADSQPADSDDLNPKILDGTSVPKDDKKKVEVDSKIDGRTRKRQEGTLTRIFGEDNADAIEELTQDQIVVLAQLVGDLYKAIPLSTLGDRSRNLRSEQFVDYISGMSRSDLSQKYQEINLAGTLTNPINNIHKELGQEKLNELFVAALTAYEEAKSEQGV